MFESGFLRLGSIRGVPIRLHWTVAIGALIFSGFRFAPAFWLAFFLLVLIHELGHTWFVQRLGHRALAIDVTGFGGLCHWDPRHATRFDAALIAWGGVLAQLGLLVISAAYLAVRGPLLSSWEAQILHVFTTTNLWLIVLNLLPFPPLDGAQAWSLFGELKRRGWRWPRRGPNKPKQRGPKHPNGSGRRDVAKFFERISKDARDARR